jgi:transaldolase
MAIFVDSGDVKEIRTFMNMGILRGVTTNPTILLKDGVTGGMEQMKKRTIEIAQIIHPYPLSIEVTSNQKDEMLNQAREFSRWSDNIVVKVTIHGPYGELENLEVIHILEQKYNIHVNVTAMMSAQQCFLAALAGATYVSLFGGRVNNMGYNCIEEICKARKLIDNFDLEAKIIVGSTREVLNIVEWLTAGTHIVTVAPSLLKAMIVHPYTKETVQQFLLDAQKAQAMTVAEKEAVPVLATESVKASRSLEFVNKSKK